MGIDASHSDKEDIQCSLADSSWVECVRSCCDRYDMALCHHHPLSQPRRNQPVEVFYPTPQLTYTWHRYQHQMIGFGRGS